MIDDAQIQRLLDRATERISHGDLDGAIDVLQELLAADPDISDAHALLAFCFVDLRSLGAAHAEALEALVLDGESALAHSAVGHVYMARGSFDAAGDHLQTAISLQPSSATHYESMGTLDRLRRKPYRHWLDRALELDPEDPDVLAELSRERFESGDIDGARRYADQALAINAECGEALLAKARVLLVENEVDDARDHVVAALRRNAANQDALTLLVAIRARKNPVMGLWMRWNLGLETMGDGRRVAWLVGLLVASRLLAQIATDLGLPGLASVVRMGWLAFVASTWSGEAVFRMLLRRELRDVKLDEDY